MDAADSPQASGSADRVDAFWVTARSRAGLEVVRPPAWAFGAHPDQADALLTLVLDGKKTATASALWDYEAEDEPPPAVGDLSIVLDGVGRARALIAVTNVEIVPFNEVPADHAKAEGEGDLSLGYWRREHEQFFRENAAHGLGFRSDMPVVLERFRVLYRE